MTSYVRQLKWGGAPFLIEFPISNHWRRSDSPHPKVIIRLTHLKTADRPPRIFPESLEKKLLNNLGGA